MDNNFDIFKKRVTARGATLEDRMTTDKLNSFKYALKYSYNSEDLEKDSISYKAVISDDKVTMDHDQKNISIENKVKVGDILFWPRTDSRWLIITQNITERAYFRGDMRKAIHKIKWRDDKGIVYEQWVSVLGPVETKIKEEIKKSINFDVPNYSLTLWLGASEGTTALKRYKKIFVMGKVWEITVVDDITSSSLIKMSAVEDEIDKDKDNIELQLARDSENIIMEVPNGAKVSGAERVSPLTNLEQTYTIDTPSLNGVWSVNPLFATILLQSNSGVTIKFTGKAGMTKISYVDENAIEVSYKHVKVTSMLG